MLGEANIKFINYYNRAQPKGSNSISIYGKDQCWWCSGNTKINHKKGDKLVVCTPVELESSMNRNGILTYKFNQNL